MSRHPIRKRTEPTFTPTTAVQTFSTALPAGDKWTFGIKFDGLPLHCREAWKRGHVVFS
jgi:hypothetical protein